MTNKTTKNKPEVIYLTNYNIVYNYPSCDCTQLKQKTSAPEKKKQLVKKTNKPKKSTSSKNNSQKENNSGGGIEGDDFSTHIYPHLNNIYTPCNRGHHQRNSTQSD